MNAVTNLDTLFWDVVIGLTIVVCLGVLIWGVVRGGKK